jgi:biopolymer transport protein ExbD
MKLNSSNDGEAISEINVTPLVDVMLVLLVIFMITVPYMVTGLQLDLPKTKKADNVKVSDESFILSINYAGELYIKNRKFLMDEIVKMALKFLQDNPQSAVLIRADSSLNYGKLAKVMSHLKYSGISKISLVTELEQ